MSDLIEWYRPMNEEDVRRQARRHAEWDWDTECPQGCGVALFRAYVSEYNKARTRG